MTLGFGMLILKVVVEGPERLSQALRRGLAVRLPRISRIAPPSASGNAKPAHKQMPNSPGMTVF